MIAHAGGAIETASTSAALTAVASAALLYGRAAAHERRGARSWSGWRSAAFATGVVALAGGIALDRWPGTDGFTTHVQQHLLVGMVAPLGLALGAPLTLLLRSVPRPVAALVGRLVRSRPARAATALPIVLAANVGGLVALYSTPLYGWAERHPLVHVLVHVHLAVAGYLFAWTIAGADPAPHRPSLRTRLVALGIAIAGHATVAQLIYAGAWVRVPATAAELRAGGSLMYYGGDLAELALALALLSSWWSRPQRTAAAGATRSS